MALALDIYQLLNNPFAKVQVAFPDSNLVVTSFLSDDQGFSFGNQFDAPFESMGESLSNLLTKLKIGASIAGFTNSGQASAQTRVQSVLQTILQWTGSSRLAFSMKLTFVAINPNDDVRQMIGPFIKATNPTFSGLVVTAPLNYNVSPQLGSNGQPQAQGGASIQIGNWFKAPPIFIIKDFRPTFSRASITSGAPLYCVADVSFESFRMLSSAEVQAMYTTTTASQG